MFISFGMFIGLIILTIIMIALIIYLTFTGGNKQSRHNKVRQAEEAAKERLAQSNMPQSEQHLNQDNFGGNSDFRSNSRTENRYHQELQSEESVEEDDPLRILPYPKDDHFN